jgi:hypothetical protein
VSLGNAAAFLLIAVLAGAVLWRGRFPFWVRVGLVLLALLGMALTLLSGMGLLGAPPGSASGGEMSGPGRSGGTGPAGGGPGGS